MGGEPLKPKDLHWRCEPGEMGFTTTDELDDLTGMIGQDRAIEALHFGIGMPRAGYNIYALGPEGLHKHSIVRHHLEAEAAKHDVPPDLCYVNNFDEPYKPYVIKLPAGRGSAFKEDTEQLVHELSDALRAAFETDEYRTRRQMIEQELKEKHEQAISEVEEEASERGIALQRTPMGFAFAPARNNQVMSGEDFHELPEDEQNRIREEIERLQERLQEALRHTPDWVKQTREKVRELNEHTASYAVGHLIEALKRKYDPLESVQSHLERVRSDIIDNVGTILAAAQQQQQGGPQMGPAAVIGQQAEQLMRRYQVNLLVDNSALEQAPVVYEDDPAFERLIGRIEHRSEMGALTTDFHLIRPGALHRANGGYLVVDALKLLTKPMAWEGLKRALRAREIRIESPYQALGLFATVSLEPEPIPLDLKVVVVGERRLYYLLSELDPEFQDLFKVAADFDEHTDLTEESRALYARMIATLVRKNELAPFSADGVARVLAHAARLAGDRAKLSMHVEGIADLLREADYQARVNGSNPIGAGEVEAAIAARERRLGRVRERMQEEITRGTILIDTDATAVGQINALTVLILGGFSFGRPTRVTARAGLGRGNVVDIEREVELGGPIHSKGVLILSGFLSERFARERPLSLSASLVFEQSYSGVEGDSASLAELLTLLSAVGGQPLRQDLAVTGSVNQHGRVQPIGGVNEKIEGFFDTCEARGLTGRQGVVVPQSNVKHLMLHKRVLDAVAQGKFHIYAVASVDEALELFTGEPAGEADSEGRFPTDTVNGRVQARLDALADKRRDFGLPITGGRGQQGQD
ncbi:Lon protease family protein [Ferruginivarius sediminum]|uniref:endopeptidase La n=1 Tax=Ferruginivarius sediminum TaxID=2661937 RepID=A0A369TIJ2_9PROT|nr:ATP-binding protein [Ferruginivarius sediminum]RDD62696.1 ATP-binding protein [Ferruginivarius sediminum]